MANGGTVKRRRRRRRPTEEELRRLKALRRKFGLGEFRSGARAGSPRPIRAVPSRSRPSRPKQGSRITRAAPGQTSRGDPTRRISMVGTDPGAL